MKRFIMVIAALVMAGGIAFSASKVATFGVPNAAGTAPLEVDSDRALTVSTDATFASGVTTATSITVGSPTVTGTVGTNFLAVKNGVEVDGNIYGNSDVFVDGSIYLTTASPASAAGVGLWISQPDGGCSKCYVDAAGTTWACANATCPTGM